MKTFGLLVLGVVVGLFLAGAATAIVIPLAPEGFRNQHVVWTIAAIMVLAGIGAVFLTARARRPPD